MALYTNEVLVLTASAVRLDTGLSGRTGIEVQNLGPNPIFVAVVGNSTEGAAVCVAGKCRRLAQYESFSLGANENLQLYGITTSANQVTTAATIVTEMKL